MMGLYHFGDYMTDVGFARDLENIRDSLNKSDQQTITGAKLWDLIKKNAPDVNIRQVVGIPSGPGALSRFVDQHLGDVLSRGGKSGSDPIYTIGKNEKTPHEPTLSDVDSARLWTTFVRSHSSATIVLTDTAPFIEVVDTPSLDQRSREINSATREELDAIRAQYTQNLSDKLSAPGVLIPNARAPFSEWSQAVKRLGAEHYRNWAIFRVEKIIDLFVARLSARQVEQRRSDELARLLRRAQSAARAETISHIKPTEKESNSSRHASPALNIRATSESSSEEEFRSAVADVIASLPISDLRELRLPAGVFWDIINQLPRNR
ncbi:hypothetical protein [Burkholderia sp. Ac-20349]|uniref:hypothetical protein n=1 Tax=Burkholderia sp. Ac-20349 TaxID=2703893 RepID=UPI00197C071E|nr:hypothetical protein [Burkholderia sp. Ac-20349]MBN3844606.1 hypothetical protein [Burkholderia sp. Ac-20349]